jgi:hypothetical protein
MHHVLRITLLSICLAIGIAAAIAMALRLPADGRERANLAPAATGAPAVPAVEEVAAASPHAGAPHDDLRIDSRPIDLSASFPHATTRIRADSSSLPPLGCARSPARGRAEYFPRNGRSADASR